MNTKPPVVLLASAGSSGSHLASVLLSRMHGFFTGPEANVACRPDLFDPASFRLALLKGILHREPYFAPVERTDGREFHLVPPQMLTNAEAYGVETAAAKLELLQERQDWPGMIHHLHGSLVAAGRIGPDDLWVEHSPSCAVSLAAALEAIPDMRVVHIVRDPRDAVASMIGRRRVAPNFATLSDEESLDLTARQWTFLTTAALQAEQDARYLRISYEAMVHDPQAVTAQLCRHFGKPDAEHRPDGPLSLAPIARQDAWLASPTGPVTQTSVGRYQWDFSTEEIEQLSALRFSFPELDADVSMDEMIRRFGAA